MVGVVEETSKQVGTFMEVMRAQPLSLALVVMNFVLLGFLFYSGASTLTARKETVDLIVSWQQNTDKLMAACVNSDIMKMVLESLERDRKAAIDERIRTNAPQPPPIPMSTPPDPPKVPQ